MTPHRMCLKVEKGNYVEFCSKSPLAARNVWLAVTFQAFMG